MPSFVVVDAEDDMELGRASFYEGLEASGLAAEMIGGRVASGETEREAFDFFAEGWSNGYAQVRVEDEASTQQLYGHGEGYVESAGGPMTATPTLFARARESALVLARAQTLLRAAEGVPVEASLPEADGREVLEPSLFFARVGQSRQRLAKYDPLQKRDHDGQWSDGSVPDLVPGDKLKLGKRIQLGEGEELLSSRKFKSTDSSSWDLLAAEVDTPGGREVRLGVISPDNSRGWGGAPTANAAARHAELSELRDNMDEDDPRFEALDEEIDALSGAAGGLDRTAVVSPAAVAQLREAVVAGEKSARKLSKEVDAFWAKHGDDWDEREKLITTPWGQLSEADKDRIVELDDIFENTPDWEVTHAEGVISAGGDGDLVYSVEGNDSGEGDESWSLRLGIRPRDADEDWYPGYDDDAARFEPKDVKGLLAGLGELVVGSAPSNLTSLPRARDYVRDGEGKFAETPGVSSINALDGISVESAEEYADTYGDVIDDAGIDLGNDGEERGLTARFFERGDLHVVLDLEDGKSQVFEDMDPEAMRQLAYDLEEVLAVDETEFELADPYDIVADQDSDKHGFYVAKNGVGDIHLRPPGVADEDYLELSQEQALEFSEVLLNIADSYEEHFSGDDGPVANTAVTLPYNHPGHPDQKVHGRPKKKLDLPDGPDVPEVATPEPAPAPKKPAKKAPAKRAPRKPKEPASAPPTAEATTGQAALALPPRNLESMTAANDPRADALWYRAGDNSTETVSGRPGSFEMSAQMRGAEKMTPETRKRVKEIDAVMAESRLPEPILVYRGAERLGGVRPDEAIGEGRSLVGREFTDKAFVSTSTDAAHASWFGGTVLRIRAPEGTPAIRMADRKGTTRDQQESEILLDRGLTFRVMAQYGRGELKGDWGGAYVLDVEVVQ